MATSEQQMEELLVTAELKEEPVTVQVEAVHKTVQYVAKKKITLKDLYQASELPLEVGFRVNIKEITQINTSEQTYGIKGILRFTWKATKKDFESYNQNMDDYSAEFRPSINWVNDVEIINFEEVGMEIKGIYNALKINFNMKFTEEFEVANFPFDVQDLSMVSYCLDGVVWVPCHLYSKYLKLDRTWSSITDWEILNVDASTADLKRVSKNSNETYEILSVRIQVRRKWRGLIYRLIAWLLILGIMAWSTFAVHPSDIGDRLSYSITMTLTIVAFQFIISNQLPQVSYMTILDKYNLFIFAFVLLLTIESTLVGYHTGAIFTDPVRMDKVMSYVSAIIFVVGNVMFVIYAKRAFEFESKRIGCWNPYKSDVIYAETKSIHKIESIQNIN